MTTTTTAPAAQLRAVTLGRAATVHASHYVLNDAGRPLPTGYPLCGQTQGRGGQGTRPVTHRSFDLGKVTCTKCIAAIG